MSNKILQGACSGSLGCKKMFVLLALCLAPFQMVFAQGLSKSCINELRAIPETKENFDFQDFLKDLPIEVGKVKAQMKLPFGKPKDDKITDIGLTVGCLKNFPENLGQLQAMLKDAGLEMAKDAIANNLGSSAEKAMSGVSALERNTKSESSSEAATRQKETERRKAACKDDGGCLWRVGF